MPSSIVYKGEIFSAPSVVIDTQNERVAPSDLEKSIAIFGAFPQLQQNEVYTFDKSTGLTVEELYPQVSTIRNIDKLWKQPIKNFDGQAQKLSLINVAANTQASVNLKKKNDNTTNVAQLKARLWGLQGNSVQVRIEDPSTPTANGFPTDLSASGTKYYRIFVIAPGFNNGLAQKRVAGAGNQIKISCADLGVGSDRTCAITCENGVLSIAVQGQSAKTYTLSEYGSHDDLKAAVEADLNGPNSYSVTITVTGYSSVPSELDEFSSSVADGASLNCHAHTAALYKALELSATFPAQLSLTDNRYRLIQGSAVAISDALAFSQLAGGTESAVQNSDYYDAFNNESIKIKKFTTVAIQSNEAEVHGFLADFLNDREINQLETNGVAPAGDGTYTIDNVYDEYIVPNQSYRLSIVAQKIKYSDYKGISRTGDVWETAALIAFMQGALPIAEPITRKLPNIINTVEAWNRENDKHELARKSITAICLNENSDLQVIRGLSTWLRDNLLQNTEISARESIDASNRDIRAFLTGELGTKILSSTKDRLKLLTSERLKFHIDRGIIKDFKITNVTITGDTCFIDYNVAVVTPLNFIKITNTIVQNV